MQFRSLARHLADDTRTPGRLHDAVTADVRRAAGLLDTGLAALASPAGNGRTPDGAQGRAPAHAPAHTPVRPTVENMPR